MSDQKEKILIVDDEVYIRKLLTRKLSMEGYQYEEADNAEHALDMLKSVPIDLVILDIQMPGKSGIELLPEIKAYYPHTAVIMATAVTDMSIAIRCMKQGSDDYVCKPFNFEEVLASIARTLEKRNFQLKIETYQLHLEEKVDYQTKKIRNIFLGAIEALVFALEAKDKYTAGHSRRTADIAVALGKELGLTNDDIDNLRWAGLLHDFGKIAVDQLIQNKPSKLTPEEYEHVMTHSSVGAGIVKPVVDGEVVEIIKHHHDHYNGRGLYQVIAGKDIPIGARILAVADAFDAITSKRPYRSAMNKEFACVEIERCKSKQFDPEVVNAFSKITNLESQLLGFIKPDIYELLPEIGTMEYRHDEPTEKYSHR
ncbi:HD domain-containing phosphohydrolase [Chloroflexota bacterium]